MFRTLDPYTLPMRSARFLAAALAVGTIASAIGSPATRAADIGNIPGVPLTSSSVSSVVGGEIYDHVYSLDVVAGTVLLITLRGEPGAELGLYVFDSEATSVYESDPFETSALPGANQSISTQFFGAARIYIDVNGRNVERAYRYQLDVSAVVDSSPPVIRFAGAEAYSRPGSACAVIDAVDGISGVQSVALLAKRTDQPVDWQPYGGKKRYCANLVLPDGPHELTVAARNFIGLVSYRRASTTVFDSLAPSLVRVSPGSAVVNEPRPVLTWRFSEPVRLAAGSGSPVTVYNQLGSRIPGSAVFDRSRYTLSWRPRSPLPVGTLINAVPNTVFDRAGNPSDFVESIVVARKRAVNLELSIGKVGKSRLVLLISGSARLTGKTITLLARNAGIWSVLKTIVLTSAPVRVSVDRDAATRYQVVWPGSERLDASRATVTGQPLAAP